jgi:hypothetical protein
MKLYRRFPPRISCILASCAGACILAPPASAQDIGASQPWPAAVTGAVGWEHLGVGNVEFGGKYDFNTTASPIVATNEQQDGNFNGVRTDVMLSAPVQAFGWSEAIVRVKGFYAPHDDSTVVNCVSASESAACDGTPLFDPSSVDNNSLGLGTGETVTYRTDRNVQHWGASLEAASANAMAGDLQHGFGIGYRAIGQDMDLSSLFSTSGLSQDYDEALDTHYLGLYWGMNSERALSDGLRLTLGGEAGLYWARTDYDGTQTQTDLTGPLSQSLSLDEDKAAFIGALNLGIEKPFRRFTLSGFMRGEYYSYAPEMAYNQTDAAAGFPGGFSIAGPNSGTSIGDRDAWSFTVGGAVRVPLY